MCLPSNRFATAINIHKGKEKIIYVLWICVHNCNLPPRGRRFERPNHSDSYADGSVSNWLRHPCHRSQSVGAKRSVAPGSSGWAWGWGPHNEKIFCYEISRDGRGLDTHRVATSVKKKLRFLWSLFILFSVVNLDVQDSKQCQDSV